jgi:hypothetical protein
MRGPDLVPPVEGGRVVDAEDVDLLGLEADFLELLEDPVERDRSVRAGEDVLVHL